VFSREVDMKIKVCGMKYQENLLQVADLQPDYLGFIFYDKTPRNFTEEAIPKLSKNIQKVGVFVNATIDQVLSKVQTHQLQAVQLHGNETAEYCRKLKERHSEFISESHRENLKIIKVFSIKDTFNFSALTPYEGLVDYFLFDTKGKNAGGNGYTFNWETLKGYPSSTPYFLSGGIGLDELDNVLAFLNKSEAAHCHAIDINSKFEIKPGLKNIEQLKQFINKINEIH
jgi:phosphoribosylanthranilate isomerase